MTPISLDNILVSVINLCVKQQGPGVASNPLTLNGYTPSVTVDCIINLFQKVARPNSRGNCVKTGKLLAAAKDKILATTQGVCNTSLRKTLVVRHVWNKKKFGMFTLLTS